jgi:uncharacterized membrane protein YuzA (DUF378 family)
MLATYENGLRGTQGGSIGAILRYAVTAHVAGVSLTTVGLIFIIVGIAGVLLSLLYMATARSRVRREPYDEVRYR